jgi:AraC-like DNA-binding protein
MGLATLRGMSRRTTERGREAAKIAASTGLTVDHVRRCLKHGKIPGGKPGAALRSPWEPLEPLWKAYRYGEIEMDEIITRTGLSRRTVFRRFAKLFSLASDHDASATAV